MNFKSVLAALLVLLLQRVPLLNRIPAIRDAGTVEGALRVVTTALKRLEAVVAAEKKKVEIADANLKAATEAKGVALANAARAERLGAKFADLVS